MKRRTFVKVAGLASAATSIKPVITLAAERAKSDKTVLEPARDVPVVDEVDVVICGAGPAGVAAALASARRGARTVLLELHGCLGGIWTAGLLSWILDHSNKDGFMKELLEALDARGALTKDANGKTTHACDTEVLKLLLEELCMEAGVQISYFTRVVAVVKDPDKRVTHVVTESKSGREAWSARVFVDCTGDGDVGALAGCRFDMGHPENGLTQPFSMLCLLTGIHAGKIRPYFRENEGAWAPPKEKLKAAMEKGGHSPSYSRPSLFRIRDDFFLMMANHEYGVKAIDRKDVTKATLKARKELHNLIDGLRSIGDPWSNIRIVATSGQIGTREGRRIRGRYEVTTEDLRQGAKHEDAVCKVTFGIDVHSTQPKKGKGIEKANFRSKPYDIPLRSLIAADVDGLMMAGRCISGDFIAHSSYRVTGNAVAMGEAAGRTAAEAALSNRKPQDIDIWEIRKKKAKG